MRKKIVAGNWKMNLNLEEGKNLVEGILAGLPALSEDRRVVLAPSFVHVSQTAQMLEGKSHIYAAAQDCAAEASGAFTGEVSAGMLASAGAGYVILGHSERRGYFHENDEILAKKLEQALSKNLQVIFCCGEPLEIRDAGKENEFVQRQIEAALFHLSSDQIKRISVAYEPIWAIGTGRTASSQQAQEMHAHIRGVMAAKFGPETAADLTILYGGSCNDQNAAELFSQPDVDGGLIGGASLKAGSFLKIIEAMMHS